MKLIVAASEAYRLGKRISCQQVSSMNGSPTWKMTKLMSGKCAAAPSMSQVWVASTGWGPSGTPLCTPIRLTPSSWALAVDITGEVHGTDDLVPQPLERRLAW